MRYEIHRWIKQCPNCQLTFHWRRRGQELMFSWSLSILFAILHVEVWMPDKYIDIKSNMALINAICDISQFVVVVPVPDASIISFNIVWASMVCTILLFYTTVLHSNILLWLCVKYLNLTIIYLPRITIIVSGILTPLPK